MAIIEEKNKFNEKSQVKLEKKFHYKNISDDENPYIVQTVGLTKYYGTLQVLKGVNFKAKRGEKIAFFGANGAGKTTFMEIISLIRKHNDGKIIYNFLSATDPRQRIGFQFQESKYPESLKVKDILRFYSTIYRSNFNKKELDILLRKFNLKHFLNRQVEKLSGGQQQRFNILLALFHSPELLILDELSTGLDIRARSYIKEFIKQLLDNSELTLFLVSHNIDEAEFLCDRFIVMQDGNIIYDLSKDEIIVKYGSVTEFLGGFFDEQAKSEEYGTTDEKKVEKQGFLLIPNFVYNIARKLKRLYKKMFGDKPRKKPIITKKNKPTNKDFNNNSKIPKNKK